MDDEVARRLDQIDDRLKDLADAVWGMRDMIDPPAFDDDEIGFDLDFALNGRDVN
ncbi:MAG: hypothetical protein GVY36_19985 [Verrucomicrobia bacterium]|jgi:hypothetical protein|nr:hypothetical protein [Verrucomicrobiota bacterium]